MVDDTLKTSNQKRSSNSILLGFIGLVASTYVGLTLYSNYRVSNIKFQQVKPGKVNIVGFELGRGFRIIVANQVAQLVEGGDSKNSGSIERVPMRDLLQTLQGNEEALGRFVMTVNDMRENDLPPTRVYWTEEQLKGAMEGDSTLKKKLESDLNMTLEGRPLDQFRPSTMWNGIVIRMKVPVTVNVGGEKKVLKGEVLMPYKPQFLSRIEKQVQEKANLDEKTMTGYYIEEAKKVLASKQAEPVIPALIGFISASRKQQLAEAPTRILGSATVIISDQMIQDASYETVPTNKGNLYNMKLQLSNEGRDQLWYYSKGRVGAQILLVADGIAIAAPRITQELAATDLDITQLEDEGLVKDALEMIKGNKQK